ncbi:MAG: hypothetical protein KF901_26145 [Myxococcales bacterium]|nr:hypothetical protein [Myxococcales bacterium]
MRVRVRVGGRVPVAFLIAHVNVDEGWLTAWLTAGEDTPRHTGAALMGL